MDSKDELEDGGPAASRNKILILVVFGLAVLTLNLAKALDSPWLAKLTAVWITLGGILCLIEFGKFVDSYWKSGK